MEAAPEVKKDKLDRKKDLKKQLDYLRDKDREKVRGIFRFFEVPGGEIHFVHRVYKQDPIERYDLVDGQVYELPLGIARHLNKNGWYPIHQYAMDENGKHSMKIGQKVRRFGFQSLEFVDVDDLTPEGTPLTTVEFMN